MSGRPFNLIDFQSLAGFCTRMADIDEQIRECHAEGYMTGRMSTLAKHPFWLDGGYDRDVVEACRYHPNHEWWIFRMGDVIDCERSGRDPDEMMVICKGCYVPRCGHVENDPDPCMLPRHHPELHLMASGDIEDWTVWPGSDKPAPPLLDAQ